MDAYDRCTNLGKKKILPIVLPSMVEAEKFSDHPRTLYRLTDWESRRMVAKAGGTDIRTSPDTLKG